VKGRSIVFTPSSYSVSFAVIGIKGQDETAEIRRQDWGQFLVSKGEYRGRLLATGQPALSASLGYIERNIGSVQGDVISRTPLVLRYGVWYSLTLAAPRGSQGPIRHAERAAR
jgi:hypothetical protein